MLSSFLVSGPVKQKQGKLMIVSLVSSSIRVGFFLLIHVIQLICMFLSVFLLYHHSYERIILKIDISVQVHVDSVSCIISVCHFFILPQNKETVYDIILTVIHSQLNDNSNKIGGFIFPKEPS